jgi:hypothetical protein
MIKGTDQLVMDVKDATTTHPWHGFVRFDLDAAFAATSVAAVTLVLTATDDSLAPSPSTGMVWQVQPFADLYVAEPAQIGTMALAPAQGAVVKNQVVKWTLPTSLATPGGSVFLELTTASSDGVHYWNLDGTHPPRIVIDVD